MSSYYWRLSLVISPKMPPVGLNKVSFETKGGRRLWFHVHSAMWLSGSSAMDVAQSGSEEGSAERYSSNSRCVATLIEWHRGIRCTYKWCTNYNTKWEILKYESRTIRFDWTTPQTTLNCSLKTYCNYWNMIISRLCRKHLLTLEICCD